MRFPPEYHYQKFIEVTTRIEQRGDKILEHHESQVVLAMQTKIGISLLSFGIVGAGVALTPSLVQNGWVLLGSFILLANALIFGYFAITDQINLNMTSFQRQGKKLEDDYRPYADAYDAYTRNISDATEEPLINAYIGYLEAHNGKKPPQTKESKFAIGNRFFLLFVFGFLMFVLGTLQTLKDPDNQKTVVEGTVQLNLNR